MKRSALVRKTPMRATSIVQALRPRRCKQCRVQFNPRRQIDPFCKPSCGDAWAEAKAAKIVAKRAKQEKAETTAAKLALKPRTYWEKRAEEQVNRYVRLRDVRAGCISCEKPPTWGGQWHASHFRSVGAAGHLRYHLWNIHKACSQCNDHLSGNIAAYEPRLRALKGDDTVEWLKCQNTPRKYEIDYLDRLANVFRKKANRLQKRLEHA